METGLDHIILGSDNLDRAVDWVEQRTGVRAAFGGVHPGRGTQNALLRLGPSCYLEIMALDPRQAAVAWFPQLLSMASPRLIAWAVHTADLAALAQSVAALGLTVDGPHPGARSRPDGKVLNWKLSRFRDDRGGLLPFFIEWGRGSVHPASDAPSGCHLETFQLQAPDTSELARVLTALSLGVRVERGEPSLMRARLSGPRGDLELIS